MQDGGVSVVGSVLREGPPGQADRTGLGIFLCLGIICKF